MPPSTRVPVWVCSLFCRVHKYSFSSPPFPANFLTDCVLVMRPALLFFRRTQLAVHSSIPTTNPYQIMKYSASHYGFFKGGLYSGFVPSLIGLGVYSAVSYGGVIFLGCVYRMARSGGGAQRRPLDCPHPCCSSSAIVVGHAQSLSCAA